MRSGGAWIPRAWCKSSSGAVIARTNQVRIIGGRWRGRNLRVLNVAGLRPSPDRVRETLFNWLTPHLVGAHCLDLFAGSGVLGLEALSRGAESVTSVERDPRLIKELRQQAQAIGTGPGLIVRQADALSFLRGPAQVYDIVFIDPPFKSRVYEKVANLLTQGSWLNTTARIYVEADRHEVWTPPEQWHVLRSQNAGQVQGNLYQVG